MIHRVILLGDRRVSSIMTQRGDIEWLDLDDSEEINRRKVLESTHSYFPVGQKRLSNFLGIVSTKDLLIHNCEIKKFDIEANLNQAVFVPESMKALTVLEQFKKSRVHFALVVDEYGGIAGLITLNDILEAIVGDIQTSEESEDRSVLKREDGSWLVDGMLSVNEFVEHFPIQDVMDNITDYNTIAGYLLTKLRRIPDTGDVIKIDDYLFEIVDMDGKRIDKILISSVAR
jgi:putative hemolysin